MKKILCFGDSNTWGHNPVDCSQLEKPWPVAMRGMLRDYEIISDGVCGRAARNRVKAGDGTDGIDVFREKYLTGENDFDLIIIMLGTNDVLNSNNFTPDEIAETLSMYVKECRDKFGSEKPKILLVSPILIRDYCMKHSIFSELYSEMSVIKSRCLAEKISEIARREGVYFMDAAKAAAASPIDGVHMDEKEHMRLATAIAAKVNLIFS
ncbi:MAG: GDSL-type esterase/lipase family protein [Oscillospiraceae bacterium]|nr:GDSL-type esterase/lipase family protein [Oscillospiraceae bacterium]